MRGEEVGGEALRLLLARPLQTALVASLGGAVVVAVLMTVGRTVVLEQSIQARIETPEGRSIVIVDTGREGLVRPEIVSALTRMVSVERVVAFSAPSDGVNYHLGVGSNPIPVWGVSGDIRDVAELRSGRLPGPGEALVSETALAEVGLSGPVGALVLSYGHELPVVGTYDARSPFNETAAGAVWSLPEDRDDLARLQIVAGSVRQIDQITVAAVGLFDRASAGDLRVERAAELAEFQRLLAGDISRFGRELVAGVVVGGMLVVALVVLAEVLSRRKDLGRQRALGARRSTVILLLAARTGAAAGIGTIVGLTIGLSYLAFRAGELPRPSFSAGLVVLAILSPALASVAPAWWAAQRDPALELRKP